MNLFLRLLAIGAIATSVHAQQTSVPPAPPPDMQSRSSVPPPFPPMPSREPRHRFVDMGDHRSSHSSHRALRSSRHSAKSTHHSVKASRHSTRHSGKPTRHETHRKHTAKHSRHVAAPKMSKTAIRKCHGMSYRQLLKHSRCVDLLQRELKSQSRSKHRSHTRKAATHRRVDRHHVSGRKTSARHHKH